MAESDAFSGDDRTLYDPTSEDEDGRPSAEVAPADHDILESEDERERLLMEQDGRPGLFSKKGVKIGKRERERKTAASAGARKQRKGGHDEEESSALMYEMEEGIGASSASVSRHSSESDEQRLIATTAKRKAHRTRLWRRIAIYSSIVVLFVVLLAAAYRASTSTRSQPVQNMISNGTSLFAPTTILISLDGFRADFLYRGITPTLNEFIAGGISPKYMLPSFPSVTFPNHYTMATGLYPEAHGIVGNSFYDPALEKDFYYTDAGRSLQSFWWGGEPIWASAARQKVPAAVHMWPGSEAHIGDIQPAYVDRFNGSEVLPLKVNRILELIDLPGPVDAFANADQPRPQLIAAYVPNVDGDGHKYGPNSTEIRQTIIDADTMLAGILHGLEERNLTQIVNVVVVSDHGMATTDVSRLVQLEDLVDPNEISHIDGWPLYGLRLKKPENLERVHKQLINKTKDNPNFDVYLRDEDMPERYHFSKNERIAPLWIVPKTGWAIVDKTEFDIEQGKKNGDVYHPRGLHGYDYEHPLMRAIFVARGPSFPHKPNSRVEPFQNIELYNIICDSIGVDPAPNNGTLRLPLKPIGLHTDPDNLPDETPVDPVESHGPLATMTMSSLSSLAAVASGLEDPLSSLQDDGVVTATTPTSSAAPPAPSATKQSLWEWLAHKADQVEEWVDGFVHKHVPDEGSEEDGE
ncbi:alkaline-phosphatase-like protein [Massariosphaeria phaeospora]|uniref:Alkaline-phosphatase-like protein n=1 Tax=Massariosphaeria phaeospora TaxID=100035 RepID=A0A7C8I4T6_9PLEO|nr:alkaline-phosphatase-like protein [Massariosphaeria phaeospora]